MDASPKLLERIDMRQGENKGRGIPIIRDSQIPVKRVLEMVVDGETREAILDRHPSLEPEDIQASLLYAYHAVEEGGLVSKWFREVAAKRPRRRPTPEELEAKRRELREIIEEADRTHKKYYCPTPDDCQCREDDIEDMLEQSGRGRRVIP